MTGEKNTAQIEWNRECVICGHKWLGGEEDDCPRGDCHAGVMTDAPNHTAQARPDVGNYRGSNIPARLNLPERGGLYEYVGIAVEDRSGVVALDQLASDEVVVFPGLIYRWIRS